MERDEVWYRKERDRGEGTGWRGTEGKVQDVKERNGRYVQEGEGQRGRYRMERDMRGRYRMERDGGGGT